jgi:hypothetical protein
MSSLLSRISFLQCRRERNEFDGRGSGFLTAQVPRKPDAAWGAVLLKVRSINSILKAFASRTNGAHLDLAGTNLDDTTGILQESAVPTPRLQAPRSHEDTALHYHRPYADESVRHRARLDAHDLANVDGSDDLPPKAVHCFRDLAGHLSRLFLYRLISTGF